mgnify:CR=1 FL=1
MSDGGHAPGSTDFDGSEWLTLPAVARHFGVSTHTIRRWIHDGRLPAEKRVGRFGEQFFVPSAALERARDPAPEPERGAPWGGPGPGRQLIGRRAEFDRLRAALHAAIEGRGGVVLVAGDAGVGKTVLVEALGYVAIATGVQVMGARCFELDGTPPYGPWLEMFRPDRAPPDLPVPAPALSVKDALEAVAGRRKLHDQVLSFLVELSRHRPVLLLLGDMHWADEESIHLVRHIGRQIRRRPILIVVTYRHVELRPDEPLYRLLPHVLRETEAERITLREWDRDDVAELVTARYQLSAADQDRLVTFLLNSSEGNPFFINELLQSLEDEAVLRLTDEGWILGELSGVRVPPLLRQLIDERLERLAPEARHLLQAAAVIGEEIPIDVWQAVTEVSDEALADVIEQALAVRVMVEMPQDPVLRFRHKLFRQSLYEHMILLRRRSWHRRIAEVLAAEANPDPDVVARHFSEAGDPRAAEWLIASGRRAAGAFALAVTAARFEKALAILEGDDQRQRERAWLLCELAEAYRFTDPQRAIAYLDTAQRIADELGDEGLQTVIPYCKARVRTLEARNAFAELRESWRGIEGLPESTRHVLAGSPLAYAVSRATYAQVLAHYGAYGPALEHAERFLEESPSADPREQGTAYFAIGLANAGLARPSEARAAFDRARTFFRQTETYHMVGATYDWELDLVLQVYYPDRVEERRRLLDDAARAWRHSVFGALVPPDSFPTMIDSLLLEGRWEEARASATAFLSANAQPLGMRRILADLDRRQGDTARAWARIAEALPDGPDTEPPLSHFPYGLRLIGVAAELALDDGDLDWARRWILALERWLEWSGIVVGRAAPDHLWARYYAAQGDLDRAWQHQREGLRRASNPRQPLAMLTAHRTLARLATLRRDFPTARQHLAGAERLATSFEAPYALALVQVTHAELLLASGRGHEAGGLLAAARATAEELGAKPLLAVIDHLEPRPTAVPGGLSAREIEVLRLVAEGLTDAEVAERLSISPRTVGGHLQSIYNKLGISSRTAATSFAHKFGLVR